MTGQFTITQLTIRQFLRAKSVLVVAGICVIPVFFAIILRLAVPDPRIWEIRDFLATPIFVGLFASTLLPLAALVLSTAALGDEIEDRTLPYLTMKPSSRLRIVVEKYIGTLLVTVPIAWGALLTVWLVSSWGFLNDTRDMILPMLVASLAGIAAFSALFLLISLYSSRALLIGIFYVFVWESLLSQFLPGIRTISIRHYTQSIFVRLLDDPVVLLDGASRTSTALITVGVLIAVTIGMAAWRLRTMNLQ
ncbi:MAG: ABC transporter permease subunit [Chloroflexia bacterium]|nr:ABC transporter permease subunit [Chloroflexia bacterium]MDQ3613948.1 ABC transporter permease subunit [Chloroflexota bacterium]